LKVSLHSTQVSSEPSYSLQPFQTGDAWILNHGCSSPALISLILHTEIKTLPVLISTPKADTNFVATALTWELLSTCHCSARFFPRHAVVVWPVFCCSSCGLTFQWMYYDH